MFILPCCGTSLRVELILAAMNQYTLMRFKGEIYACQTLTGGSVIGFSQRSCKLKVPNHAMSVNVKVQGFLGYLDKPCDHFLTLEI